MYSYRKMLEWKPEDPSIETVVVTTWEKCGEGQELRELLARQDGAFTMPHAPFPVLEGGTEKVEAEPRRLDFRLGASAAVTSTAL